MLFFRQFSFSLYQLFKQNPLFFIAYIFAVSLFCMLTGQYLYLLGLLPLLATGYFSFRQLVLCVAAFVFCFIYGKTVPINKEGSCHANVSIQIESISFSQHKQIIVAKILSADTDRIACPAACMIKGKKMPHHISGKNIYRIRGIIKIRPFSHCLLIPQSTSWKIEKQIFSLVDLRSIVKQKIDRYIRKHIDNPFAASLISSLITANKPAPFISYIFAKAGLQHILAISGFHFALVTFCLFFFFRFFLPLSWVYVVLIAFTNLYYIYLGSSPSIERAWVMTELFLFSRLFNKRYFPLNALGCACLIEGFKNPLVLFSLSFQLSYLACCFIILLFPLFYKKIKHLFIKKSGITSFFINSFSLTLAVNFAIIPFLLFKNSFFPIYSFLYNLLIPPLIMPIFLLFFFAAMFSIVPFVSHALFILVNFLVTAMIKFIEIAPYSINIYCNKITKEIILSYLIILLFIGLYKRVLPFFQKIV